MTAQPSDIYEMLKKIRYDATAIQAKVTDALNMLNELNLPSQPTARCDKCGLEARGPKTLAEHMYVSHGGPVPEHYVAIEERSLEPHVPVLEDAGEIAWETSGVAAEGATA